MGETVRVLHVDDDPDYLERSARLLARANTQLVVTTETDPDIALARLESETFDCVLSDFELSGTDGLAFLESIRDRQPDLPFVLYAASKSDDVASVAIDAGVTDYVSKAAGPTECSVLANRIENAIGGYTAEHERRVAVEQAHSVYERITDGFFALDADWRFTHLNRRAEKFFERDESELIDVNVWEAFPESVDTAFYEEFHRAMETQRPVTVREYFEPLDAWFESRAYPSPEGLSVFVRNVTEQERIQRELGEIEARMEALSSITANLHACETIEAVAERIVNAAVRALDFDVCYVGLRDGDQFVPVGEASKPTERGLKSLPLDHGVMGETYRTGQSFLIEDVPSHPLAEPVHGDYQSAVSVPIGDAGVFQAVSNRPADFTESDLELAEALVSHATEAIARIRSEERRRAERERITALFQNVPEPAIAYELRNGEPIVKEVNAAFEEVFGYDADEVVGENIDEFIVPVDHAVEARKLNEKLEIGETVQIESRRRTATGERDFLLQVVPLVLGERNAEGFAIYTDITRQKARERELERQNDRLEAFASVVSHDLRNPLAIAQGHLSLAREKCANSAGDHFDAVERAHDRMAALTEDILALARQGRTVGETRPVDVAETVAAAWTSVQTDDVTIEIGDLESVVADPDRLRQLVENLLSNAIKHGGPGVTIQVDPIEEARGFVIADDGPGVPADRRAQVFEAGYTDAKDGTGFGLAIVESIVDAHGWTIEIGESESGGASFEVRTGA